jgi:hypothetical protein
LRTRGENDVDFELNELGRQVGQSFGFSSCRSILNGDVFPFEVSELAQTRAERLQPGRDGGRGGRDEKSYARDFSRLLRLSD